MDRNKKNRKSTKIKNQTELSPEKEVKSTFEIEKTKSELPENFSFRNKIFTWKKPLIDFYIKRKEFIKRYNIFEFEQTEEERKHLSGFKTEILNFNDNLSLDLLSKINDENVSIIQKAQLLKTAEKEFKNAGVKGDEILYFAKIYGEAIENAKEKFLLSTILTPGGVYKTNLQILLEDLFECNDKNFKLDYNTQDFKELDEILEFGKNVFKFFF